MVKDRSGGTTHQRISRGALGRIGLCIPNVDEQKAIAQVIRSIDRSIDALEERIEKLRNLKDGSLQQLISAGVFE